MEFHLSQSIGVWIAALLSLAIFSFLYKDNPIYKFAEHLFVGVSAGYQFTNLYHQYLKVKMIIPLTDYMRDYYQLMTFRPEALRSDLLTVRASLGSSAITLKYFAGAFFYYILPAIVGLLILTRLIRGCEWMSKYPIAYTVGYGAGMTIMIKIHSDILEQLNASVLSVPELYAKGGAGALASYLIIVAGLCCCLAYFYFSAAHRGPIMGTASKVGIWVLMITFGAQFGFTIMARISLLIGRMQYLLGDWLGLIRV